MEEIFGRLVERIPFPNHVHRPDTKFLRRVLGRNRKRAFPSLPIYMMPSAAAAAAAAAGGARLESEAGERVSSLRALLELKWRGNDKICGS